MKRILIAAACFPLAVSAEQQRSLGAHEHGAGTLGIAVSGSEVAMSLEAPGADIVGFEHEAANAEDRAAVATAVSELARPLELFVIPESAGCSVTAANVSLIGDHLDEHAEDDHSTEEHAEEEGAEHTEFRAEYTLTCAAPQKIDRIEFAYFERFPNAHELDVQVVTDKGAQTYEVEREAPALELKGMF
ncbi:DUF2796 domain-containing protein [Ruegeria sp. SCP11]|uniref:DUF2796 domain-containing protein n=1 Tax=Ruegeria sp. SCP11 TaxID=3141378 RepID=UPI00333C3AB7